MMCCSVHLKCCSVDKFCYVDAEFHWAVFFFKMCLYKNIVPSVPILLFHSINTHFSAIVRPLISLYFGSFGFGGVMLGVVHKSYGHFWAPLPLCRSFYVNNKTYVLIWTFDKPLSPFLVHMVYEWPLNLGSSINHLDMEGGKNVYKVYEWPPKYATYQICIWHFVGIFYS